MSHLDASFQRFMQRAEELGSVEPECEVAQLLAEIEAMTIALQSPKEAVPQSAANARRHSPKRQGASASTKAGRASSAQLPPRPALPLSLTAEEQSAAAERLHHWSSRQPCLQADGAFVYVETLILCHRLEEAEHQAQQLPSGQDRLYLCAEVAVRRGDLEQACSLLSALGGQSSAFHPAILPPSPSAPPDPLQPPGGLLAPTDKCTALLARANALLLALSQAQQQLDSGGYQRCVERCEECLGWAATHLPHAGVLQRLYVLKARGLLQMGGEEQAAIQVLAAAVDLGASGGQSTSQALWLLADALMQTDQPEEAFERLHELQALAPDYPGLAGAMQQAATQALNQQNQGSYGEASFVPAGDRVMESCQLLGITHSQLNSLSRSELDRVYRRRAAECHPDKQVGLTNTAVPSGTAHSQEEQQPAASQFIAVRQAFEHLTALVRP